MRQFHKPVAWCMMIKQYWTIVFSCTTLRTRGAVCPCSERRALDMKHPQRVLSLQC